MDETVKNTATHSGLKGVRSATPRDSGTVRLTTINGYTMNLSADAYDVASSVSSDVAADTSLIVDRLIALPIRDEDSVQSIRDGFAAECTDGAEAGSDTERAWLEYADEIVDAAVHQVPCD